MATTSGAAFAVRTETQVSGPQPRRRARHRLSVVRIVEAYVDRRRRTLPAPSAAHFTGAAPPGSYLAPVRPGRVDKPATLAHYQAMADQVATERRLAELDLRRDAVSSGGVPREVWFAYPARPAEGVRRHG